MLNDYVALGFQACSASESLKTASEWESRCWGIINEPVHRLFCRGSGCKNFMFCSFMAGVESRDLDGG